MNNILNKQSQEASAMYKKGCELFEAGRYDDAVRLLEQVVAKKPAEMGPYAVCATAYTVVGRNRDAVALYDIAIHKDPDNETLYVRRMNALYHAEDIAGAMKAAEHALVKFPRSNPILLAFGMLCSKAGPEYYKRGAEAVNQILEQEPQHVEALNCFGALVAATGQYRAAINYYIKALRAQPDHIIAMLNTAGCFEKLKEPEMALNFYNSILKIDPTRGVAMAAKATILANLGLSAENVDLLKQGIDALKAEGDRGAYIVYSSNYVFYIHYVPHFPRKQIKAAIHNWYEQTCGGIREKTRDQFTNIPDTQKKLRIGMISNSFKRHPVTWMTLAALENMDRDKYEIFIYSDVVVTKRDDVTHRYYDLVDKVFEANGLSNPELVHKMREDNLDILLELTGHSEGGKRLAITAARVAPVQVKWVGGLFDTTGVPQMDWIIGDKIEIPEEDEKWYSERVYRMPDDYIVYEPPTYVSEVKPLPALKSGYVTFSNLNNLCKTNTYTISLWARILKAVPRSRLLMKVQHLDAPYAKKHIEEGFAQHGIGIDRLILEGGDTHKSFMETYNRVDIALDPHPYTGGLSTCEALWMGVPVITLPGETFAGRHAATHLYNAGLPEWIAKDEDEYVAIATKWANDLEGLAKLRAELREQVRTSPLCDGPRFAKNFEKALRFMWKDWCDEKMNVQDKCADTAPKKISPPKPKKKKKK